MLRGLLVGVLAGGAAGCRGPVSPPAPVNLLRVLGVPRAVERGAGSWLPDEKFRGLNDRRSLETRAAVELQAGRPLFADVSIPAGARLTMALAVTRPSRDGRTPTLSVSGDGRILGRVEVASSPQRLWVPFELGLNRGIRQRLAMALDGVDPEARVALGSLRLERAPTRSRRVLVWISVDTLRADHVGRYGYSRPTTPSLDRWSQDWLVLDDAVSPSSWTLPALVSQMTARSPSFHGATLPTSARDRSALTVFQALWAEGFQVLGVTGNPFISTTFALADGFDALWTTSQRAGYVTQLALSKALAEAGPSDLALFVHYMDPHAPYSPPPAFAARMASPGSPSRTQSMLNLYDGEIAFTDNRIGRLLDALKRRGLLDQAVLVFTADHGEEFQDHGGFHHGHTLYQELEHVPVGLGIPGLPAGRIRDLFPVVDLAPTILEALRVPAPPSFLGRSRLAELRNGRLQPATAFAETELGVDHSSLLAVREGPHKYVMRFRREPAGPRVTEEMLFDLATDPHERAPRRDPASLERLRKQARDYLERSVGAARAEPARLSPETREQLRALGYIE